MSSGKRPLSCPGGLPYLLWHRAGRQYPFYLLRRGEGIGLALVEREPGILEPDDPLHAVEQQIAAMAVSGRNVVERADDGGTTRRSRRVLLDDGPELLAEWQQALDIGTVDDVSHATPPHRPGYC